MQPGPALTGVVHTIRTRVFVAGVERDHVSLKIAASIDGDLPGSVTGGAKPRPREGTIEFAWQKPVLDGPELPWKRVGDWPPLTGDRVEIWDEATIEGEVHSWKRFTGRIDTVSGDTEVSATIVDDWDRYRQRISVLPMMRSMPGAATDIDDAAPHYSSRLAPWGPVYRGIEQVGRGMLPPVNSGGRVMFHAAFQGGIVPDVSGVQVAPQVVHRVADQDGVSYVDDITLSEPWGSTIGGQTSSLAVTLRAPRDAFTIHGSAPYVTITGTNGSSATVTLYASGRVTVSQGASNVADTVVDYGPGSLIGVSVLWTTSRVFVYSMGASQETSVNVSTGPPALPTSYARVRWAAGVRVARGQSRAAWLRVTQEVLADPVVHDHATWGQVLEASPMLEDMTAEDLLTEYAQKQLMSVWLDEHGVLQVVGADRFSTTIRATFSTDTSLDALPWSQSWAGLRSSVDVPYREAAINLSQRYGLTLWQQTSSKQMQNGDQDNMFVEPGPDEDWVEPDFVFSRAGTQQGFYDLHTNNGSVWAATYSVPDGTDGSWAYSYVDFEASIIGPTKVRLRHTVSGLPSAARVHLNTVPDSVSSNLWMRWRNTSMPIVRGRGRIHWTDEHVTTDQFGPAWAPQLVHDLSWWGRRLDAQLIGNYIAARIADPIITLDRLPVAYDPRIQLGDVVRVNTPGVALVCRVTGIDWDNTHQHHQMRLTARILTTTTSTTWGDVEDAWSTYTQLEAARDNDTYQDFERSPLEGS